MIQEYSTADVHRIKARVIRVAGWVGVGVKRATPLNISGLARSERAGKTRDCARGVGRNIDKPGRITFLRKVSAERIGGAGEMHTRLTASAYQKIMPIFKIVR